MGRPDLNLGSQHSARSSRDAQPLQQTLPTEAMDGSVNVLGLWSRARVEGWRGSAESEGKRIANADARASGRGARASSLQQQPEQNVGSWRPQWQLQKKMMGVLGWCATQGTGRQSADLNLVSRKVVMVVWCEAMK